MGHKRPNMHHQPVRQVSNADLDKVWRSAMTDILNERAADDPTLSELQADARALGSKLSIEVMPAMDDDSSLLTVTIGEWGALQDLADDELDAAAVTHEHSETLSILADDETMAAIAEGLADLANEEADLYAYYDSFQIGALRKIASQAGFVGAYKGPKKNELVEWCVVESKRRGVRV